MLTIKQLPVLNDNYIYLIHESKSGATAVIDPAIAEPVINTLTEQKLAINPYPQYPSSLGSYRCLSGTQTNL